MKETQTRYPIKVEINGKVIWAGGIEEANRLKAGINTEGFIEPGSDKSKGRKN